MTPYGGYDVVIVSVCMGLSEMFEVYYSIRTQALCVCVFCSCMFDVNSFSLHDVGNTAMNSLTTVYKTQE